MTLFATAAVLSVPQMQPDFGSYPSAAMRADHSAAALIEIVVDPAGNPIACETLEVFGNDALGRSVCSLQRSATFEPALDELGKPTHGIVRALVKYVLIGSREGMPINRLKAGGVTIEVIGTALRRGSPPPDIGRYNRESGIPQIIVRPDVVFDVTDLPGDSLSILERVIVAVDTNGNVTECAADPVAKSPANVSAYLVAACQNLREITIDPLLIDGDAVTFVRPLEVQFAVSPGS